MRNILLLVFGCLLVCNCFSQQKILDSLLNELSNHSKENIVKLDLLNKVADAYSETDPEKSIAIADEAISLAQILNNPVMLAGAYANKGRAYDTEEADSTALYFYNEALHLYEQANRKLETGNMLHGIGVIYQRSDQLKALKLHQKALNIFQELNDKERIATEYRTIGVDYNYLSDYTQALGALQKSLTIFETADDRKGVATVYGNMGITYRYLNNFKKSLEYHQKSLGVYKEIDYLKGMADELGNMGNVYDDMDDSAMTFRSYREALEINTSLQSKTGIASDLANLGIVYNYYHSYKNGHKYLSQALLLYEQLKNKEGISLCLSELALMYRDAPEEMLASFGILPNQRYQKVVEYQKRALALAEQTGSVLRQAYRWDNLADTYQKKKDFKNALYAFQKAVQFRDSVVNDKKTKEITRIEMRYDFAKREDSVKVVNEKRQALASASIKEERAKKDFILAGALVFAIASIAVFIFYKRRRDAEDKKHEAEFKLQTIDTEMKALRAQMNPHFIYNSLNSINDYIDKHDTYKATLYTTKFAKLMRMILENSEHKEIPLADDMKALELYMQLEALRLNNKFSYEIKVDDAIDPENTLIPPLILQPFVENSIWHGMSQKMGNGKISIIIKEEGDMINCIVEDNGTGIQEKEDKATFLNAEKKSFGMKITNARIDIINQLKKSNANVTLSNLEEGTRVEVLLPEELAF